jgi:hypothetical protein
MIVTTTTTKREKRRDGDWVFEHEGLDGRKEKK